MNRSGGQVLIETLRRAEKLFATREAVSCGDVRLTYAEFASRCRRMAGGLRSLGVGPGDRVATLMLNCHQYLQTYFAVPGLGAVLVPLNNRHAVAEHRHIIDDAGARVLIADRHHAAVAAELAETTGIVVVLEADELLSANEVDLSGAAVTGDHLAGLFYTSGTTGRAKGVMLTHANLTSNAQHAAYAFGLNEHDSYLHAAPMFHLADGTCTYGITWVGGRHVILPRFDPVAAAKAIAGEGVTLTVLVPTMISSLVEHAAHTPLSANSLRLVIHGGAPTGPELCRAATKAFDCSFSQVYGMTEAGPLLTVNPREEELPDSMLLSVGREILGVQVDVRRADGTRCAPGEIGEIVACGPNITSGYWNKPEETAQVLRGGWYWTGDLGYRDENNALFVVDRAKDMIITGGENVYSAEVELVLAAHPGVREVAVIGIPDPTWGERVHAVISPATAGDEISLENIRSFCKQSLAGYKAPSSLEVVDELPKSSTGKILKAELRRPHWDGHTRNVH